LLRGDVVSVVLRFEELECWQAARELARGVYRAAQTQPLARDHSLQNQMKRAAISVSGNIAEGFERGTRKQQIELCHVAKGSVGELRSQVIIAHDVGLLDDGAFNWLRERCERCSRLLHGYIRSLRDSAARFPGDKFPRHAREESPADADTLSTSAGVEDVPVDLPTCQRADARDPDQRYG